MLCTNEFAQRLGIMPNALYKAHAKHGSYFGVVPAKGANGRLLWPADAVAQLLGIAGGAK